MTDTELMTTAASALSVPQSNLESNHCVGGHMETHPNWSTISRLPMLLAATVPLCRFKVSDLMNLHPGQLIESKSSCSEDISIVAGKVSLGHGEFEIVEQRMSIRLTRLA